MHQLKDLKTKKYFRFIGNYMFLDIILDLSSSIQSETP